jgi:hypothetical protein
MMIDTCARCHEPLTNDSETCPACGYDMRQLRLPQVTEKRALVEWRGPVPGLLQGAALAGAGVALRYVLPKAAGLAARKAGGLAARRILGSGAQRAVARRGAEQLPPATLKYISETRIIRRVWTRD